MPWHVATTSHARLPPGARRSAVSTPKPGTRPSTKLREAPHDWLWYLIAGAAIDDIVRAAGLLRRAAVSALFICFGAWLALVLAFITVLHFRTHRFEWVPALSLFRSVRLGL